METKGLRTAGESLAVALENPEFRREWGRTALARAVAIRVVEYRATEGISQTELGRRLGMHQPAIARLESGSDNPTIETLMRLSQKLGIDLNINIHSGGVDVERLAEVSA